MLVNTKNTEGEKIDPPSFVTDIRISNQNEHGRRFGLWSPDYITEDEEAPALVYLAPVAPHIRTRFKDNITLKQEGLLTEGYCYKSEPYTSKSGILKWDYSCPSLLIAYRDSTYQILFYDVKDKCRKEVSFTFDGNEIIVQSIVKIEPRIPRKPKISYSDKLSDIIKANEEWKESHKDKFSKDRNRVPRRQSNGWRGYKDEEE